MTIDFAPTAADYAHRPAFPPALFDRLRSHGIGFPSQRLLDVGSGTGLFSRPLALRGWRVVSTDVAPTLLREARRLDLAAGVAVPHAAARAERLPFAGETFDAVTAAQCWHWFDRRVAPTEIARVLRPAGRVAVVYQMYLPLPGTPAHRTEQLILRHNPRWRHANSAGINGQVLRDLQLHGFRDVESFSFDVAHSFTHDAWRAFVRSTSPVGPSLSAEQVAAFDRDHAAQLSAEPEILQIPHRVFAAVATKGDPPL